MIRCVGLGPVSYQAAERLRSKSATIKTVDVRKARRTAARQESILSAQDGSARGGVG